MKRLLFGALLFILTSTSFAMQSVGPVQSGSSVWKIAATYKPGGVNTMQMIEAIYRTNPNIFPGGTAGPLRAGVTLMVPTTKQEVEKALKTVVQNAPIAEATAQKNTQNAAVTHMQSTISQLKQMVGIAQQSRAQAQAEAASLNQQISQLEAQNQQLKLSLASRSTTGFPWSWMWFVLLAIAIGGFAFQRFRPEKIGKVFAKRTHKSKPVVTESVEQAVQPQQDLELEEPSLGEPLVEEVSDPVVTQTPIVEEESPDGIFASEREQLMKLIEQDPNNIDLRIKLLEFLVRVGDQKSFDRESKYVLNNMVEAGSPMWNKIRGLYLNKWVYDN